MAHSHTQPMLPGWSPLSEPTPRPGAQLGRWRWPATVLAAFAAVAAYVFGTSPGPGVSTRGLVTLGLAVLVLTILTLRRRWGPLAVLRTLAEYAAVAALAGLLVLAATQPAAERPAGERRPAATEQASSLPPVIRQVVGAAGWLAELWERAERETDQRRQPPPTTRGERSDAAPLPDRTGGPSS